MRATNMPAIWYCDSRSLRSVQSLVRRYLSDRAVRIETRDWTYKPSLEKFSIVSDPRLSAQIAGVGSAPLNTFRGSYYHEQRTLLVDSPWTTFKSPTALWTMQQDLKKLQTLAQPDYQPSELSWTPGLFHKSDALAVVVDIETTEQNTLSIVGLGSIYEDGSIHNSVLNMHDKADVLALQEVLQSDLPLITHNGKFDFYHLLRHGFSPRNWRWDTEYAWNAWRAEHKKSLAYVASILLPDYQYWKQTASSDLVLYNAKDCWYTARAALEQLRLMPDWAHRQARKKMSRVVPALACEIQGLQVEEDKLAPVLEQTAKEVGKLRDQLCNLAQDPDLNPNSPPQVKLTLQKLGFTPKNTSEDELLRLSQLQLTPAQSQFISYLLEYRGKFKALTTYYEAPLLDKKLLYTIQVDGTETDRGSSRKSSLYVPRQSKKESKKSYGAQLQNIPPYYRTVLRGPEDWSLLNIDIKQGDAYGTAYMSGDLDMIKDLENPPELSNGVKDFYCFVAYKNFQQEIDKKSPIRQLQKKICHASGYLMGAKTFVSSCASEISPTFLNEVIQEYFPGQRKTEFAARVIKEYLKGYPQIQKWWRKTKQELRVSGKIVTPDGWVREFCGDPEEHNTLRAAVAHQPQHMTVVPIWETFVWAYYELQVPHQDEFRLIGQVHDSIMAIAKENRAEYYQRRLLEKLESFSWGTTGGTLKYRYDPDIMTYWGDKK